MSSIERLEQDIRRQQITGGDTAQLYLDLGAELDARNLAVPELKHASDVRPAMWATAHVVWQEHCASGATPDSRKALALSLALHTVLILISPLLAAAIIAFESVRWLGGLLWNSAGKPSMAEVRRWQRLYDRREERKQRILKGQR